MSPTIFFEVGWAVDFGYCLPVLTIGIFEEREKSAMLGTNTEHIIKKSFQQKMSKTVQEGVPLFLTG